MSMEKKTSRRDLLHKTSAMNLSSFRQSFLDRKKKATEIIQGYGVFAVYGPTASLHSINEPRGATGGCYEGERGMAPPEVSIFEHVKGFVCEIPFSISREKVKSLVVGAAHFLVLTEQGHVYGRGDNRFGQLGLGPSIEETLDITRINIPHKKSAKIDQVQALGLRSAAISSEGELWMWGTTRHETGELVTTAQPTPLTTIPPPEARVGPLMVVQVQLSAGYTAILVSGETSGQQELRFVYTWGVNTHGQLGHGDRLSRPTPTMVAGLEHANVKYISSGPTHMAAIAGNLRLYMWGSIVDPQNPQTNYMGIPSGGASVLVPKVMSYLKSTHRVRCGDGFTLAVCGMRSCWAWGLNIMGALGIGTSGHATKPTRLSALSGTGTENLVVGRLHSVAQVRPQETEEQPQYWSWGVNHNNCLGQQLDVPFNPSPSPMQPFSTAAKQIACGDTCVLFVCDAEETPTEPEDGALDRGLTLIEFVQTGSAIKAQPTIRSERPGSFAMVPDTASFSRFTSRHQFVVTTFPSDSFCSFCASFLWGLVRQGVQCRLCGFIAHPKCVPAANVHMPCVKEVVRSEPVGLFPNELQESAFNREITSDELSQVSSFGFSTSSTSVGDASLLKTPLHSLTISERDRAPDSPLCQSKPGTPPVEKSGLDRSGKKRRYRPHLTKAQPDLSRPVSSCETSVASVASSTSRSDLESSQDSLRSSEGEESAPALPLPPSQVQVKIGLVDDAPMVKAKAAWFKKTLIINNTMTAQQVVQVLLQKVVFSQPAEVRASIIADCSNFSLILAKETGVKGVTIPPGEVLWPRLQEHNRVLFFSSSVEFLREAHRRKRKEKTSSLRASVLSTHEAETDNPVENSASRDTIGRKMGWSLGRRKNNANNNKEDPEVLARLAAKDQEIEVLRQQLASQHEQAAMTASETEAAEPEDDVFAIDIDPAQVEVLEFRAHGTAGDVYRGRYLFQDVAIKLLRDPTPELLEDFRQEILLMRRIKTKQVVYFYGVTSKPKPCLVMEWCAFGSLMDVLRNPDETIGWNEFFSFGSQAIQSVYALHVREPPIVHRDLKTLNYLVDRYYCIKLCDFGLARMTQQRGSTIRESLAEELVKTRGTYEYLAPEIYKGSMYSPASDVYSLAILLWEIANRCLKREWMKPYGEMPKHLISVALYMRIAREGIRPTIPDNCPGPLVEFLKLYWNQDPTVRPSVDKMMEDFMAIQKIYEENITEWDAIVAPVEEPAGVVADLPNDDDDQIIRSASQHGPKKEVAEVTDTASSSAPAVDEAADSAPTLAVDALLKQYKALMEKHPDQLPLFERTLRGLASELEGLPMAPSESVDSFDSSDESIDP